MRDADSRVDGRGLRNAHAGRVVSQRRMTRTNDRRGRRFHTGQERGHVPSAVPGATTCPRSNREEIGHRGLRDRRGLRRRRRTGTCSKRRPRRDNVYPFGWGRDWPQRAPRSQRFKTPEKNGDMFQAPSPARQRVPVRTTGEGALSHTGQERGPGKGRPCLSRDFARGREG